MRQTRAVKICLLILTFCLAAVSAIAAAASTIRVGYPQLNGGQIPLWNIPEQKLDPIGNPGGLRMGLRFLNPPHVNVDAHGMDTIHTRRHDGDAPVATT